GVGPELAYLRDCNRLEVRTATDDEALQAFELTCRAEGILPALEPSHAIARARDVARELGRGKALLLNLSGRGDKDLAHAIRELADRGRGPDGGQERADSGHERADSGHERADSGHERADRGRGPGNET